MRVNNTAEIVTASGAAANFAGITIGGAGGGGLYSNIKVKEVVDFAANHDDTTRSSVITALNNALTVF